MTTSTVVPDIASFAPHGSRALRSVSATFLDEKRFATAIQGLIDAGIPEDEISVVVADELGKHPVHLEDRNGAVKGALLGGLVGAVLGGIGGILAAAGMPAGPGIVLVGAVPLLSVVRGVVAGAGFGYGLGVLEGLEHWKVVPDLEGRALGEAEGVVTVHSNDLHERAREVLGRSEADRISL